MPEEVANIIRGAVAGLSPREKYALMAELDPLMDSWVDEYGKVPDVLTEAYFKGFASARNCLSRAPG